MFLLLSSAGNNNNNVLSGVDRLACQPIDHSEEQRELVMKVFEKSQGPFDRGKDSGTLECSAYSGDRSLCSSRG